MPKFFLGLLLLSFGISAGWSKEEVPLRNGAPFTMARARLLRHGWQPVTTDVTMADGTLERKWGDAGKLTADGYVETESCSGTGLNYCFFNYMKNGQCLRVETIGEYRNDLNSPKIYRWLITNCK